MTLAELDAKVIAYNTEKQSETPDAVKLAELRKDLDDSVEQMAKEKSDAVYAGLMGFVNPMLEAARQYEYTVVTLKDIVDKESHEVTGVQVTERIVRINPATVTEKVAQAATVKGSKIPKNGVAVNGKSWMYGLERLGNMLAYRNTKDLGGSAARLKQVVDSYFLSEAAAKEKDGLNPTSNTQLIEAVQAIVDKMVFVPGKFGKNAVKVLSQDVKFLLDNIARHGKGAGVMKQNRDRILQGLLFEVCHLIVTDTPYTYAFHMKKDVVIAAQNSRNPKALSASPIFCDADGNLMEATEGSEPEQVSKPAAKSKKSSKKADAAPAAEAPAADSPVVEEIEKTA